MAVYRSDKFSYRDISLDDALTPVSINNTILTTQEQNVLGLPVYQSSNTNKILRFVLKVNKGFANNLIFFFFFIISGRRYLENNSKFWDLRNVL